MTKRFIFILALAFMACAGIALVVLSYTSAGADLPETLPRGKQALDKGDYIEAVRKLTAARAEIPLLDDYALFWRARAYEGLKSFDKSLEDIRTLLKSYPDSPLTKAARFREIEVSQAAGEAGITERFTSYLAAYPSDLKAKYAYAVYLKGLGETAKAAPLFKELFLTVSPFSRNAADELKPSEITSADLLKKAKNLNSAWLFKDAERYFRQALLRKDARKIRKELTEGLAYAVFMQKRYKEAVELYDETTNRIWRAKALFRTGDLERFEKEVPSLLKLKEDKAADILISYGARKRRMGDSEKAIEIFNTVASKFPASKEEALWQKAWTHFRSGSADKALGILTSLSDAHRSGKYLYWKNRCLEILGKSDGIRPVEYLPNSKGHNFYVFLSASRSKGQLPAWSRPDRNRCASFPVPDRIAMLRALGFASEAISEMNGLVSKNMPEQDLICLGNYFEGLGDFKTAISLAQKVTYRDEYHDLYYPLAYLNEVRTAAVSNGLDPFLITALMREESRFSPEVRSSAGALGLMQLMPQTAFRVSKSSKLGLRHAEDLYQPKTNILIGSAYLKTLVTHFGSIPKAVASYNAGEEAVKDWLARGNYRSTDEFIEDIPYDETRNYVKKVMTSYFEYLRIAGKNDAPDLFP